jgi:hypothetical protein
MRGVRLYSVLFWVIWSLLSILRGTGEQESDGFVVARGIGALVIPIVLYLWCKADAAVRTVHAPPGAIPLLAVAPFLGWAYYIAGTRRPLRAFGIIACSLLLGAGIAAAAGVASQVGN